MVQTQTINITQRLLSNISSLYQLNEITNDDRLKMVAAVKTAVRSHDYREFLNVLNKTTRFCSVPELINDCKTIINQQNNTMKG